MTNETITIPGLPALTQVSVDTIVPVAKGAADYAMTIDQLRSYMKSTLAPITEDERQKLALVYPDWYGSQPEYNALGSYDAMRNYFITFDDEVVAIFRGNYLIHAVPNMVGEFSMDSTPDDWYWWPNGIKTPLPVNPATCRFSFYWPGILKTASKLFMPPDVPLNDWRSIDCRLTRLEKIPPIYNGLSSAGFYYLLSPLYLLEQTPVIDCRNATSLYYICIQNQTPTQWERLAFTNTEKVTTWDMAMSLHTNHKLKIVEGLDATSLTIAKNAPLSLNGAPHIKITNLGKAPGATSFDLRNKNWGDDSKTRGARQSLVDSLLTYSFDRASAGYAAATITLSPDTFARLTAAEVSAINAKGFTIVTQ